MVTPAIVCGLPSLTSNVPFADPLVLPPPCAKDVCMASHEKRQKSPWAREKSNPEKVGGGVVPPGFGVPPPGFGVPPALLVGVESPLSPPPPPPQPASPERTTSASTASHLDRKF